MNKKTVENLVNHLADGARELGENVSPVQVPEGPNYRSVWNQFILFVLRDEEYGMLRYASRDAKDAITHVASVYDQALRAGSLDGPLALPPSRRQWQEVRAAAYEAWRKTDESAAFVATRVTEPYADENENSTATGEWVRAIVHGAAKGRGDGGYKVGIRVSYDDARRQQFVAMYKKICSLISN